MCRKQMGKCFFLMLVVAAAAIPAIAQGGNSEVFVFEIKTKDGAFSLAGGANISNSPGYDNQPSFSADGKSVLFTSVRNGKSPDIYEYVLSDRVLNQITTSEDAEYTPRAKDSETIFFIREGNGQEMTVWKYDRKTKVETQALINKEPVAYYDWNSDGGAIVWVRYASMAHYLNPQKGTNIFVSDHVLPSTPQNIPGTLKFSFVHRQGNDEVWIKEFDPETNAVRPIVQVKESKIDYCWLPDKTLVIGIGSELFGFNEERDKDWTRLADLKSFGLKDVTRLSASSDGTAMAIVSNQE